MQCESSSPCKREATYAAIHCPASEIEESIVYLCPLHAKGQEHEHTRRLDGTPTIASVHNRAFHPLAVIRVGITAIHPGQNERCTCGIYFGEGLGVETGLCLSCNAPWPKPARTEEGTADDC